VEVLKEGNGGGDSEGQQLKDWGRGSSIIVKLTFGRRSLSLGKKKEGKGRRRRKFLRPTGQPNLKKK